MWLIRKDYEGWGVVDEEGIFENQRPFKTKEEALAFRAALHQSEANWQANKRYWASIYEE